MSKTVTSITHLHITGSNNLRSIQRSVRRVLHDECGQLVTHVQETGISARLTALGDDLLLLVGIQSGLRVIASRTQNELLDETIE